jgi:preprotein translocase subunit SecD
MSSLSRSRQNAASNAKSGGTSLEESLNEASKLIENSVAVSTTLQTFAQTHIKDREPLHSTDKACISTFLTGVDVSSVPNQCPTVSANRAVMSADLSSRIQSLADIIGVASMKSLMSSVQANLDQVCRISRVLGNSSHGEEDVIRRLQEEETLRTAAESTNEMLREKLSILSSQVHDLQQQVQVLTVFQEEANAQAKRKDADYRTLENELSATAEKLRMEEAERLVLVDQMRKKEAEVHKCKETVEKLTSELQRLAVRVVRTDCCY